MFQRGAQGYVGGDSEHALRAAWDAMRSVPERLGVLHGSMCELVALTRELLQYQRRRDTSEGALLLSTAPTSLNTRGFRHNRLYAQTAGSTINVEIAGERFTYTTVAGWNPVDWPENTIVSSAAVPGSPDHYILQLTDEAVL